MKYLVLTVAILASFSAASASDTESHASRLFSCEGPGSKAEIYVAGTLVKGQAVSGFYALDLTDIYKGKSLEPIRITLSTNGKSILVDQFTRGLKKAKLSLEGGIVDLDRRFAKNMNCEPEVN